MRKTQEENAIPHAAAGHDPDSSNPILRHDRKYSHTTLEDGGTTKCSNRRKELYRSGMTKSETDEEEAGLECPRLRRLDDRLLQFLLFRCRQKDRKIFLGRLERTEGALLSLLSAGEEKEEQEGEGDDGEEEEEDEEEEEEDDDDERKRNVEGEGRGKKERSQQQEEDLFLSPPRRCAAGIGEEDEEERTKEKKRRGKLSSVVENPTLRRRTQERGEDSYRLIFRCASSTIRLGLHAIASFYGLPVESFERNGRYTVVGTVGRDKQGDNSRTLVECLLLRLAIQTNEI